MAGRTFSGSLVRKGKEFDRRVEAMKRAIEHPVERCKCGCTRGCHRKGELSCKCGCPSFEAEAA